VLLADAAVACVRTGEEVVAPPVAAALADAVAAGRLGAVLALPGAERAAALDAAAEVVPQELAPAVAEAVLADGGLPLSGRLAVLCAVASPTVAARLLDAARGFGDDVWAGLVAELVVAAADRRVPPSPGVRAELDALDPLGLAQRELLTLQLRLAARDDAAAALPLVVEAVDAVGAYGVEPGIEAVLGRTGPAGTASFAARPLADRALARRAAAWEAPDGPAALRALLAELAGERDPEAAWTTGFELLGASARLGDAPLAAAVVEAWAPPAWGAWNAVWAPLRKRGSDAQRVLDAVEGALTRITPGPAADGAGPPPAWEELPPPLQRAYAELRSRPDLGLPWWRAWDGGLP
jgi:hypothetical protein